MKIMLGDGNSFIILEIDSERPPRVGQVIEIFADQIVDIQNLGLLEIKSFNGNRRYKGEMIPWFSVEKKRL